MQTYSPLFSDFYQLTMLAGYFAEGIHETPATFDLYFRKPPFQGSYAVFAGLKPALDFLENLQFGDDDIAYLRGLNEFTPEFLDFLKHFRFRGKVTAMPEGTCVFPREPLVTVEGTLAETQYVETALLNCINFQTLVATKAARVTTAAGRKSVLEFGLRRAQGPDGGLSVARAAYIGGIRSTSNIWAGKDLNIPVKGTHAHSWVMSFPDELTAFRAYARCFPKNCILLIDTYDTLQSGLPNAITVAREMRERGEKLLGIRIDSGDLAYLSKEVRKAFDAAGFPDVLITASSDLDEYVIDSVNREGGCVDIWGVGTRLATCAGEGGGALGGVYKLAWCNGLPKLKITNDPSKLTLPDRKKLWRLINPDGSFFMDVISLEREVPQPGDRVFDPTAPLLRSRIIPDNVRFESIRHTVMENGSIVRDESDLACLADRCVSQLERLPEGSLRLLNPHLYKVAITAGLNDLRTRLLRELQQ
ncbi:nicotinate phosphoribosyltransferase [Desulfoplanes formicivorans]|uniref:Nicotinate phosphoribosyltransferase n=1 Tax=Desulfoplanes formicivorans TaxID=1592317 RepID=A0A194AMR4_9BACT|nr:nicotinate phosphoribosyltransferase [Desulfoplanes formicivorans]GAU09909.1 nicotinate phosphoribosyltransferase [Desulfoplanes formicivorans]